MANVFLAVLLLFFSPAQKTQRDTPADKATVEGVVVKAGTGEPLKKAVVEMRLAEGRTQPTQAVTDSMGKFEFRSVDPGRYFLAAARNGYVRQSYGAHSLQGSGAILALSPGQKVSDISFQLVPAAVISGHVYDEDGEPIARGQVTAQHYAYLNGQRQLMPAGGASTNDLGEFRIFGLAPGQYILQASIQPQLSLGLQSEQGYVSTYYPGEPDAGRAAPITLREGEEFSSADINLRPSHAITIRGHVVDGAGGRPAENAVVLLGPRGSNAFANFGMHSAAVQGPQGAFEFRGVAPGAYYLYGILNEGGRQATSRLPVEAGDSDIEGVTLTVVPGVELKCRVRVEGNSDYNLGSLRISLSTSEMRMFFGIPNTTTQADGTCLLKDVSDGNYEVNIYSLPENHFLKSARLDGIDVLAAGFEVDTKHSPGLLDIVVSPNGAIVDGMVSHDQQPFQGATVAIVPDPPHRGEKRLFKSTTTDQLGRFVLKGVSPGDYKLFAWESIEPGAYTIPEFIQPYENRSESVRVTEGSHASVQLELIPTRKSDQ